MDLTERTDAELLQMHCGGKSPAAFEELYRRYGRLVYGTCLRRLGSPQEAEDAAAATFMVLLRKARGLARSRKGLAGWLQWCATNTARKAAWLRSRQLERERKAAEMREKLRGEDRSKWKAALPHLDDALASLPAAQRHAVVEHYMQGRSLRAIAGEARCPEGTVAGRARLGLGKLRRRLARHGPALSAGVLVAGLGETCSEVVLPAGLAAKISALAAGGTVAGSAAAITEGTLKAMAWMKVKLAAAVLCGAAVVGGGGAAAVRSLVEPGPNRRILAMEDNSWLKLAPPREARGRAYCGASFGGGCFWYFGGGKHTYLANDVNLFDVRRNRWMRATKPEQPERGSKNWNSMTDSGGYTRNLAPSGAPYAEQSYQQVCWVPQRERFFVVLISSGTWEFDPGTRRWHHLVNRYADRDAEPRGDWGQNTVVYDPLLAAPVHSVNSGPDAHLRAFDFSKMAWKRLGELPAELKWNKWYATWVPDWGKHLIVCRAKDGPRFYKFQAAGCSLAPLEGPRGLTGCESLACDSTNGVVIALQSGEPGRPWKLDVVSMAWERLDPSGPAPTQGGLWNTLRYDPEHNAFYFLSFLGNESRFQGGKSSLWAYRYKKAPIRKTSE